MDKVIKKRLRTVIAMEGLSNLDIAKATGYSPNSVSINLSLEKDTITKRFLTKYFEAYPNYKQWILEGTGESPDNALMVGGDGLFNKDLKVQLLEEKNRMLENQISSMRKELDRVWLMLEKAMQIHPDLTAKLLSPLAQDESMGLVDTPLGRLTDSLGTKQGAFA